MRITTLSEVESVPDIILNDRGELWIPSIPGWTLGDDAGLRIKRVQVTPPTITIGQVRASVLNFPRAWAGHRDIGNSFMADFYEDASGATIKALTGWSRLCSDPLTDDRKRQREYSINCELYIYDTTGRVVHRGELTNVWPSVITLPQIDSNGGAAALVNVLFSVDYFDPTLYEFL